jgi:hypothetical protein
MSWPRPRVVQAPAVYSYLRASYQRRQFDAIPESEFLRLEESRIRVTELRERLPSTGVNRGLVHQ